MFFFAVSGGLGQGGDNMRCLPFVLGIGEITLDQHRCMKPQLQLGCCTKVPVQRTHMRPERFLVDAAAPLSFQIVTMGNARSATRKCLDWCHIYYDRCFSRRHTFSEHRGYSPCVNTLRKAGKCDQRAWRWQRHGEWRHEALRVDHG